MVILWYISIYGRWRHVYFTPGKYEHVYIMLTTYIYILLTKQHRQDILGVD